ncbi:transcriptional regulator, AraC family with amidase-like domain [Williamsia sterculiae]|uniref:Transcriptional regulator, AraC family with amidase-like domain n=1 Tax=Williamsia sterculiae TaxID=1344003 RepID=A0A1N7CCE5_9NOCA|nr:transcriptional regulator, AraC family with amidase-like domain [Williamsia sterculiae]
MSVLALPGALPLDLAIPMQIFGLDPRYSLTVCADEEAGPVPSGGVAITELAPLRSLTTAQTVIVPGTDDPAARVADRTLAGLRAAVERGARMVSICTGVFALAAAGIIAGRTVTTHWQEVERLQCLYPDITVDPRPLFIDDGDILTSAGVTAGIDLCLHLITADHGSAAANQRARAIVAAPRRTGDQLQYIPPTRPSERGHDLAELRAWMAGNPTTRHTLADLAARVPCSPRTLVRTFEAETGLTPARWMTRIRINLAREILEATDLPAERLGERTGLGSPAATRAAFRRACGVSPEHYRLTFATAFTEPPPQNS